MIIRKHFKLVKSFEEGEEAAKATLLAHIADDYLCEGAEKNLVLLLKNEKVAASAKEIILEYIKQRAFCNRSETALINLLANKQAAAAAEEIILEYIKIYPLYVYSLSILYTFENSRDNKIAAAARRILRLT